MNALGAVLAHATSLQVLDVRSNGITAAGVPGLLAAIRVGSLEPDNGLKVLECGWNNLGSEGLSTLVNGMVKGGRLERLGVGCVNGGLGWNGAAPDEVESNDKAKSA